MPKCVSLNVSRLFALMTHDPSPIAIFCFVSDPVPVVADGVRGEEIALVAALRLAVAAVQEQRAGRRDRDLAEAFVARPLVRRKVAVEVGAVVARVLRPVVRRVEVDLVGDHRAAEVTGEPGAILLVARQAAALEVRRHRAALELPADLAGVAVRAGLADGIDRKSAGTIEVDRSRRAPDRGDLFDVVRGRLRRERAEERQRHVDAVELVDVVLAAAAGARAAGLVLRVLHAGNELDEIAVSCPTGRAMI